MSAEIVGRLVFTQEAGAHAPFTGFAGAFGKEVGAATARIPRQQVELALSPRDEDAL